MNGYPEDSDERKVRLYNPSSSAATLFSYGPPVSPHLCGDRPTDDELQLAVLERLERAAAEGADTVVLETFGGPGSPVPSRSLQVDALRPQFLPSLLVGDSKLGGTLWSWGFV